MPVTRYTKSHNDMSAVKQEHRHCTVTEAGGKPRPLSCAGAFLVTSAPMPHGHHIPMHSHTHIQVPWNTCTHTHTLTSTYHSRAQPAPDHPQSGHMDPRVAQSILHLLPAPPFSPSQGWSKSTTKAQCPLLPFPLNSPLPPTPPSPTSVHPLCPPAAEPERESRQSGRDIAPRLPGVQAAGQIGVVSAGAAAAECPGEVMAR